MYPCWEYLGDPFNIHNITDETYRLNGKYYIRKFLPTSMKKVNKLMSLKVIKKALLSEWPRTDSFRYVCIRVNHKFDGLYIIMLGTKYGVPYVRTYLNTNDISSQHPKNVLVNIDQFRPMITPESP